MWPAFPWCSFVPSTMTNNKHHKAMTTLTTTLTATEIRKSSVTESSAVSFSSSTDSNFNTIVNVLIDGKVEFTFSSLHLATLSFNKMKKMGLGFGVVNGNASNFIEKYC